MKKKLNIFAFICGGIFLLSFGAFAQGKCTESGSIRSITTARSGNFETVTVEFVGRGLPDKAEISDIKPPIENYGGDNLHMKGRAFKSVFFAMVPWTCDIRENFKAKTSTIRDVKQTEQFEGYVSYAIGYSSRSKYVGKKVVYGKRSTKFIVKFKR